MSRYKIMISIGCVCLAGSSYCYISIDAFSIEIGIILLRSGTITTKNGVSENVFILVI
ncbi:hypothetical protein PIROE2DRAFT_18232 [Piromyces sp. E2]|nr:hypothetical protein PIROE2DRAFT_18232 [Piromyces sp. E2]|eukprot:OUM56943.1 hypothetical protein PIROE2DRAFT_18232 [Piromyces sp. E2]